jgi:hypothetical protein
VLDLADRALKSKNDLLGRLGLLVEDGLGLSSVTGLLSVVSSLTLSEKRSLSGLVLRDLHSIRHAEGRKTVGKGTRQRQVRRKVGEFPIEVKRTLWGVCFRHSFPLQ